MPKQLITLNIAAPGFLGLNTERKGSILPEQWCTEGDNCVIDKQGRVAARKGYKYTNTTAITSTPDVKSIHEYIDGAGNSAIICAAGNAIYRRSTTSLTDISGTITTPTADNWQFVNFNGNCIGFQTGHTPIVATSTGGNFADITLSGTQQPSSTTDNVHAAFGRLWCIDGTDLKYSDSLDHTAWNGVFDLTTVWLSGMDEGVAVSEFNGHLIVFGKHSIVVYNNPWDPASGGTLDTTQMSLVENISGIGCIARDSIQHIGTDILFLSSTGVRSLSRTIQEKSMPVRDLSKNNKAELLTDVATPQSYSDIKSVYSQKEGMYLLSLPNVSDSVGEVWYFDLRQTLEDGSARMMKWDMYLPAMATALDDTIYLGHAGYLSEYTGYLDGVAADGSGGSSYQMAYSTPWIILEEQAASYLKIPKNAGLIVYGAANSTLTFKWAFDFRDVFTSRNITIPASGSLAEYGIAEFGIAEFGGGNSYSNVRTQMSRNGRVLKVGLTLVVSGFEAAIQQITIQSKIGKMVI